jgi:lia operon protein LiaF
MKSNTFGVLLLVIGLVYVLDSFGVVDIVKPSLTSLWPVLPLILGVGSFYKGIERLVRFRGVDLSRLLNGAFWIGVGGVFLSKNLGLVDWNVSFGSLFWPLFLVWIGIQMVTKRSGSHHIHSSIGEMNLNQPWTLTDNTYSMWVGEITIDVSKAFIPETNSHLEVTALAGECTIIVPAELGIAVNADMLAGEINILDQCDNGVMRQTRFKSSNWDVAEKRLTIDIRMKAGEVTVRSV